MSSESGIFIYIEPVEKGVPGDADGLRAALTDEMMAGRLSMIQQVLLPNEYMVFCLSSNAAKVYSLLSDYRFHSTEEGSTARILGGDHDQPGGAK